MDDAGEKPIVKMLFSKEFSEEELVERIMAMVKEKRKNEMEQNGKKD